jgi:formate dehydrogenase iron-sulfur subunit
MLDPRVPAAVLLASVAGGAAQLIVQGGKFLWLSRSETFELRSSSLLLAGRLRALFVTRLAILIVAGMLIPMTTVSPLLMRVAFAAAFGGELLGRYLFFVAVVPKNIAAAFAVSSTRAA